MKIKVVGAAGGEVTGSAYLVSTRHARLLVDAGMFQGSKESEAKNRLPKGADPEILDAVLLTHAHLDHTGRLPMLLRHGYRGPIIATGATLDLAEIILNDAARIQVQDASRKQRHKESAEPLYGPEDMDIFRDQTTSVPFHQKIPVAEGISARFFEAGHMLGSASIELTLEEDGQKYVVVFSGDLGPLSQPIMRDFDQLPFADFVFIESTYGDRDHRPYPETILEFEQIVKIAVEQKGKILIPVFAVGRAQQILYHLAVLFFQNKMAPFPVYVDSPMATEAGRIFRQHPDLFDQELLDWKKMGIFPVDRRYFKFTNSVQESIQLNHLAGPCAILAGAGMCNAGRIQHHLKFNLPNPNTHVLMVGYQGEGSLGRQLIDGKKRVKIHGMDIDVNATIHTLNGFSAHAGQKDLLKWLSSLAPSKPLIALTHGENRQREALALALQNRFQLTARLPEEDEIYELLP